MKCINCIHYKQNPEFDYYDNPTWYAKCEKEREDVFESDLEGVYQDAWGYGVNCSDYVKKGD